MEFIEKKEIFIVVITVDFPRTDVCAFSRIRLSKSLRKPCGFPFNSRAANMDWVSAGRFLYKKIIQTGIDKINL